MKYLCDTHILLWWLNDESRLKKSVKTILSDKENTIYISHVSAWEMVIKQKSNPKFLIKTTIEECFKKSQFQILELHLNHIAEYQKLKEIHHDPFDLMLISQVKYEGLKLITADKKIWKYNISLLKA